MTSLSALLLCIAVPYLIWNCQSLFVNYRKARQSGFPILVCPANTTNIVWLLFSVIARPFLSRFLPAFAFDRIKASIYGWEFQYKYELFARHGSSFILVTPGKNELMVTDPEVAHAILSRRNDFMPAEMGRVIMGMFGPNVNTAEGDDWKRQRKIVAPLLNERISESVWKEASEQAQDMVEFFVGTSQVPVRDSASGTSPGETDATIPGVRSIAINVLGSVSYGTPRSWKGESPKAPKGYRLSYMESILTVVDNLIPAAIVPVKILTSPVLPQNVQRIGYAVAEFRGHVRQLLEVERGAERPNKDNLMSTLVRVSDAAYNTNAADSKNKNFLSEDELAGNLFLFTVAGFDTTANTMAYAITLLAISPEWQGWIQEELDTKLTAGEQVYDETFPKLTRCLALMFEVLRLYTPVAHIARETKTPQSISTETGNYRVPIDTTVYITSASLHINPATWGPDALSFRPTRWILDDGAMIQPPRSSFLPWSGGPRTCPGQKMAEVEFVAVMMTAFRDYNVQPSLEKGETIELARERLRTVMADSQPIVTLQMNRPKDVKLKWERREKLIQR